MLFLQVQLLGKFALFDNRQTSITLPLKAQELFVYLFVHRKKLHEREKLANQLWPDFPENRTKKYLRQALWQLQTALAETTGAADDILRLDGSWVQLNLTQSLQIDAHQLKMIYLRVRDLPIEQISEELATEMEKVVSLYRGDFVTGWYHDWCILERVRFQSMLLVLLDKLVDYCLLKRRYHKGTEYGMEMLRYDTARERSHRRLMRLYYLADNRTAALRQFEMCKEALAKELQVAPSKKTMLLLNHIQADDGFHLPANSPSRPDVDEHSSPSPKILNFMESIQESLKELRHEVKTIKISLNRKKDASTDS